VLGDAGHVHVITCPAAGQLGRQVAHAQAMLYREVVEQAKAPRSSSLPAAAADPRLAALGAKLEEARQLYQQLLGAERADACSSLDAITGRSQCPPRSSRRNGTC
jgi:hypothetical protein